ncbi:MAG: hypothetical protein ACREA9_24670 [Pyrinomonadaceae bacterium]
MPTVYTDSYRKVHSLVIAITTKPSDSLQLNSDNERILSVLIVAPAVLTGTVNLQFSLDDVTWENLQIDGGSSIAIAAETAQIIRWLPGVGYIRLNSGSNEAAARTFSVVALATGVR